PKATPATSAGTSRSSSSAPRATSSLGSARSSPPRTRSWSRRSRSPCRPEVAAYRASVFDMDGLLVDSEILWHQAELEILVPLGATIDADATRSTKGMFVHEVVE